MYLYKLKISEQYFYITLKERPKDLIEACQKIHKLYSEAYTYKEHNYANPISSYYGLEYMGKISLEEK